MTVCLPRHAFAFLFLSLTFAMSHLPGPAAQAQDRAAKAVEKFDSDGDGKVSRDEWRKSPQAFKKIDADSDGYLTVGEFRARFEGGGRMTDGGARRSSGEPPPAPIRTPAARPSEGAATTALRLPDLYFVDAHSQMARGLDPSVIIPLMNQAGVWHTILSARNDRKPKDVVDFAAPHPDRITAAVRSKGRAFNNNSPKLKKLLEMQLSEPTFRAMAEAILYHAQKGNKAPEISVAIDDPQSLMFLEAAQSRGWPFIAHYEFAAAGWSRDKLMQQFEATAQAHPKHPFVLIHMGQLTAAEATRLIETHPNVYFMTSHSNPVNISKHPGQPWTNLFYSESLASAWQDLFIKHPDRFILAFDNVWPEFWGPFYLEQAALWRKALMELPEKVAHAIAHGNAERLWKLPVPGQ